MSTNLWAVCQAEFFPRRLRLRSGHTRAQYRFAINAFGKYLGRPATLADLNDDAVTMWTGALLDSPLSVYTVREKLGRILTLWRWCAARRLVECFPTLERPEPPDITPIALREDELRLLFRSAAKERGHIAGIPSDLWWTSHFGFMFCTSERKSAALSVRIEWIDLERRVCSIPATERKGRRKAATYTLWEELIPLLRQLVAVSPQRQLAWPWPFSEGRYYDHWGRIARDAGLPDDRKHKSHSLRVSHATWRQVAGGDSTRQLMHSDPSVTARHYIDRRMLPPDDTKLFIPWDRSPPPSDPRAA
jgi:integrase